MRYVLLVGGCAALVLIVHAVVQRWLDAQTDPTLVIKPPTYRYLDHDEALQQRTQKRRHAADGIRAQAARIETGEPQKRGDLRVMGKR